MAEKLIKMKRSEPAFEGGPTSADVHPAEVKGFQAAGWVIVPEPAISTPAVVEQSASAEIEQPKPKKSSK